MKNIAFATVLLMAGSSYCQSPKQLLFKLSVGNQQMGMEDINAIILDSELYPIGQLNTTRENSFTSGNKLVGSLGYQLTPSWEVGIYSNYQSSSCDHSDGYEVFEGGEIDTFFTQRKYFISSLASGIYGRLNLSNITHINNYESFLGRTLIGANFSVGFLNSYFTGTEFFLSMENDEDLIFKREFYRGSGRGIHAEVSLDLGLKLTDNNLFSAIGAEFGYQYLVSSNLSNRSGDSFLVLNRTAVVDMSGFFVNAYLKIGR